LDGLRGVAIIMVVVGHVAHFSFGSNGVWSTCSSAGVSLFFALSGFLITNIVAAEIETSGRIDFVRFYLRRCLRLLPALFAFLGTIAIIKLLGLFPQDAWSSLAASVLYVRNIFGSGDGTGHLWSLSLEEQFYFTWPILLFLIFKRRHSFTLAILIAIAVWRAGMIHLHLASDVSGALYERPWFRYDSILYGCFISIAAGERPAADRPLSATLLHPLLTIPLLAWSTTISTRSSLHPIALTLEALLAASVTFSVVVCSPQSALYRALASAPLRFLGRISYSLYLWQQPFLVVRQPPWHGLRTFPTSVGAALFLAILSYYLIERPFLSFKSKLSAAAP
jgi:peptidoglycan/LPS O-acetylase OafA/YrhL